MPFDTEILQDKINRIKIAFENGQFADELVSAINAGNGLMQQRVFTENKDIAGNGFGQYIGKKKGRAAQDRDVFKALFSTTSKTDKKRIKANANEDLTSYQRKRANKGRQIAHKDLEFTGGLRRAIETQVGEKDGNMAAVLNFSTIEIAKIAHGQENQITNIRAGLKGTTKGKGIKIFSFNTSEKEIINEHALDGIAKILKPK